MGQSVPHQSVLSTVRIYGTCLIGVREAVDVICQHYYLFTVFCVLDRSLILLTSSRQRSSSSWCEMEDNNKMLRLATYMCPGIPVEYYEFLAEYLENKLGIQTCLLYSSRRRGPECNREDHNRIDVAFVSTSTYLEKFRTSGSDFKLMPVGAMTKHPVKGELLGYYSDIVVHRDVRDRIKEFYDLRGCKYIHSSQTSLSSNRLVLKMLKQMGEDPSFFSDIQVSGNHMNSIEMVVSKKAEATVVDSLSLANYLSRHYYQEPELHLEGSWGPLPPHPILVNSKLPVELQQKIESALLNINKEPSWREQLAKFSVTGFQKTSLDNYLEAIDILETTKSLSFGIMYY
ncbi:hypothetical protein Pmani_000006 [Petrolisthes manimaculis]|uniref:Phosphate/phosphite/phosphonate ABC transporter substrate-binding protein n=1 Tax=Petrolisthes manimaculis TaxID=1843537 RepID=A0AAE1QPZ0_9EUCA|nr:hypothetical protein Pmani_000006 [Petrolisthes manimaculis]